MIPADELLLIQQDAAEAACDKPCVIKRKTTTKDQYGSETEVFNQVSPNGLLAGMSEPTGGQLQNYAFVIGDLATFQVRFPVSTDVVHQDHLLIEGLTLVVQVILTPRSYEALLTVLATVIK